MSKITLINWRIIWANDPDYLNYLNDHNPWTHIILKWSKFPKLPKCPKLPWSTDSLTGQMTQITKISQITRMTTILELKSLSNWLNFQNYLNVQNYLDQLTHYLGKWPRLPKLPEWPQSLNPYYSHGGNIYLDLRFWTTWNKTKVFKIFRGLAPLSRYIEKNCCEQ